MDEIIKLRRALHQYPELSGAEFKTAASIKSFAKKLQPSEIISDIGGNGLAVLFDFGKKGPTIAFRCELDALPIEEMNSFDHKSKNPGVSHKCGHDGHMAILCGTMKWLSEQTYYEGKVVFLFQPSEENGRGAESVLKDERFINLNIDYLFALHNIPQEEKHNVIVCDDGFSAEVQSFSLDITGMEAHAAEPEKGRNPAIAIAKSIKCLSEMNVDDPYKESFAVLTPVYIQMGKEAYGISPADARLSYTIRTWATEQMNKLKKSIKEQIYTISEKHNLKLVDQWFEYFPASRNNIEAVHIIKSVAGKNNLEVRKRPYPFKFGEDFGWYSREIKTAMFGLGAGLDTPPLHNAEYDFPDDILDTGITMFKGIINEKLRKL